MPRGCRWIRVGSYFRDDVFSHSWDMYISRNRSQEYFVRIDGEERHIEKLGSIVSLIGFFEDYGDGVLADLMDTLEQFSGTEDARQMIATRLARFR